MREPTLGEAMAATYDFMTGRQLAKGDDRGYRLTPTSEIAPERVSWLWTGRVPAGTVTILDGDPGKGKSTLTAALAAAVSTGRPLPGDDRLDPGGVIFVSLEDDPAMVIVPRLIAAGAELSRVHIPVMVAEGEERLPRLPDDLHKMYQMIFETDARLVVIDPLMAALSADVNGNIDQDVRRVLAELARIAGVTGAAIVLVRHLNKSAGKVAIYRGGGSIGIIGAARSGLLLTAHPTEPGQLLLSVSKSNLGVRPKALALRIVQAPNGFGTVAWGAEAEISADDALNGVSAEEEPTEPDGELGAAIAWLREALKEGPLPAKQILAEAKENGFSLVTVKRAKVTAGIASRKQVEPEPHWQWLLPPHSEEHQGNHVPRVSQTYDSLDSLDALAAETNEVNTLTLYKESITGAGAVEAVDPRPFAVVPGDQGNQEDQGNHVEGVEVADDSLASRAPTDVGQDENPVGPAEATIAVPDPSLDPQPSAHNPVSRRCPDCFGPLPDGAERCPPCAETYAYLQEQQAARAAGITRTW